MIKVQSITLNDAAMEADVFLMSDTKSEVNSATTADIEGFPENYAIAPFSKCMTKKKELAFYGSDGTWDWGD